MCTFITATIPLKSDLASFCDAAGRHGLRFSPITNPFVQSQLPPGLVYLEKKAAGHCDCDTVLGSLAASDRKHDDGGSSSEVAKRKRMGWSERKIERWLAEKYQANDKRMRRKQQLAELRQQGAGEWLAFLRDALGNRKLAALGLLLHFYRASPTTERVQLKRIARVLVREVEAASLLRLEEDVLHVFQP